MWIQCLPVQRSQPAGSNRRYNFDVGVIAVEEWTPNASIAPNALLRPSSGNETGFIYQNGPSPGQTGRSQPAWTTAIGETLIDGSLTLTAVVPPAGGEDSIAGVTWTQQSPPDATLTIASQSNSSLVASAYVGGGTSGNVYTIQIAITMASGAIYVVPMFLTIL